MAGTMETNLSARTQAQARERSTSCALAHCVFVLACVCVLTLAALTTLASAGRGIAHALPHNGVMHGTDTRVHAAWTEYGGRGPGVELGVSVHAGRASSGNWTNAEEYPRVLILTPVNNADGHIKLYLENLARIEYPRSRLSIGLMDGDSDDEPSTSKVEALRALVQAGEVQMPGLEEALSRWSSRARALSSAAGSSASATASPGATKPPALRGPVKKHQQLRLTATLVRLLLAVPPLREQFSRVTVLQHDFNFRMPRDARHFHGAQLQRRQVLARSRNHLLSSALRDEDFVLWIDSDVQAFPSTIIQSLLSAGKQIVVPNCVLRAGGRSYDLNSWRVGDPSLGNNATVSQVRKYHDSLLVNLPTAGKVHELFMEGYANTGNRYLHHLRNEGAVVRLDAVGGAMLLVDAELHRHGLIFPPFVYRHRIETEGMSMMALDMGVLSWGMPNVEVIHH